MSFYDQKDQLITMINEASFRTTASGADTAIAAATTTYALPIVVQSADIVIPIKVREEVYGIGSGKHPSKIINKSYEPVEVTLEGSMLLGTFLGYAIGQAYTSTAAQSEIISVDCIADVSDSLDETYFVIYDEAARFNIWMDAAEDQTFTSSPGIGTDVEVSFATNATAATVATAVATAVNGQADFTASVDTNINTRVNITVDATAKSTDAWDNDTNFRIFVKEQGVSASELAHRFLENTDYQLDSFTLHVEQRLTSNDKLYDLVGCVVDSLELEMSQDGGFVTCRVGIKAAGIAITNGPGIAQTTKPSELPIEPFVWGDLDNSATTTQYKFLFENATERAPTSIESIKLTINNNVEFKPGIGDPTMGFVKSGKREIELNIVGFIQNKNLWDYWRGTFDNTNEYMGSASSKMSSLLRFNRAAGTDVLTIFLHNLYINEHDSHLQTIDETLQGVNLTLRTAQPDGDRRQIYANQITSTTYTKVYFGNTDET